jgi:uncharacterized protein (DUF4415 family)
VLKNARGARTGSRSSSKTDWRRLEKITDEEIRAGIEADPDIRPTDDEFWKGARVVRPAKEPVAVLLDPDVIAWFRRSGDIEARINDILRVHVLEQLRQGKDR